MKPYIALQGVSFSYHRPDGEIEALSDISFTVSKGEFVSLVGPAVAANLPSSPSLPV